MDLWYEFRTIPLYIISAAKTYSELTKRNMMKKPVDFGKSSENCNYFIGQENNPFHVTGLFLYPLEAIENQSFSDVFRRYKKWLEDLVAVWCYSRNRDLSLYFNCYITGLQSQ